ncbi:ATP-binding protein, partial [Pseudonocardia sp. KRD-188]
MRAPLRCEVPLRYPVGLVVVTGVLRMDSAPVLRAAVLKVLADRPSALVLDLAGLEVADPAAATVLPLIEQHAAHRAEAALLLAAPSPSVLAELRRLGVHVPVHPTRAAALAAAATRPAPTRVRLDFAPVEDAAGAARDRVRHTCRLWSLNDALSQRAAQVVNELVTNAVQHTSAGGTLLVTRRPSLLHLAVRDAGTDQPVLGEGFGLRIVDGLSTGWGVRAVPDGKVAWATLRIWPDI